MSHQVPRSICRPYMAYDSPQLIHTRLRVLAIRKVEDAVNKIPFHIRTEVCSPLHKEGGRLFLIWKDGTSPLYGLLPYMEAWHLLLIWKDGTSSLYGRKWIMAGLSIRFTSACCGPHLPLACSSCTSRSLSGLRDNLSSDGTQGFLTEAREESSGDSIPTWHRQMKVRFPFGTVKWKSAR